MKQNQKIAKELAKQIAAMGYIMDDKKMSHSHALEIVSKVAGFPNWDTLSATLKKNSVRTEMVAGEDIAHLYFEGRDMGCTNEQSVCPDVIAIIDMNRVRNAANVLRVNKGLLESVRIDADYRIGNNVDSDEFTPYGAWVDIYSTNEDGSPNFGMFCIQQNYTDDVHSKGMYFNLPHYGWSPAWVDDLDNREVVYLAHRGDARIEKCLFDPAVDRFFVDPEDKDMVMKVESLSQELFDKMRLLPADIQHYNLPVVGSTPATSREVIADEMFANYEFGDGVVVVETDNWDTNDKDDFTKIAYVSYADDMPNTESHRISFHVRFTSGGAVDEVYALEMNHGQEIGSPVYADTAPAELPDTPAKTTEEKHG